jgi:hypothetical protein
MAKLTIDTGTAGNPATGDTLRTAMAKVNANFDEVYQLVGDGSTGLITTSVTNGDLKLQANGTGVIEVDQLQISNTTITPITTNASLTLQSNGTGTIILSDNSSVQGTFGVSGNVTFDGSLNRIGDFTFSGNNISATRSNDDLKLSASGTGNIVVNDDRIVINTSKTATGLGSAGDRAGSISWDGTNLYVCTADHDGVTTIWKKLVLQAI